MPARPQSTPTRQNLCAEVLVAAFDIIPGAGISAGIAMLATGGVLFIGQLIEPTRLRLRRS
jgi:hypothetical protein